MAKFAYIFKSGDPSVAIDGEQSMKDWMGWISELGAKRLEGYPFDKGKVMEASDRISDFEMMADDVTGYVIVEAKDINEACELAQNCPAFDEDGHLEVRVVVEMPN